MSKAIAEALNEARAAEQNLADAAAATKQAWQSVRDAAQEYNRTLVGRFIDVLAGRRLEWCEGSGGHVAEAGTVQVRQVMEVSTSDYESSRRYPAGQRAVCERCAKTRVRTGITEVHYYRELGRPPSLRDHLDGVANTYHRNSRLWQVAAQELGANRLSVVEGSDPQPWRLAGWPAPSSR